jgi:thiosulfate sulfurtransferase
MHPNDKDSQASSATAQAAPSWRRLSIADFKAFWQEALVADIRDPNAYGSGHIPGAINLNNENLQSFIDEADLEKPLVVVCYHGHSSQPAANMLASAGFKTVYSLDGGMTQWAYEQPELVEV